MVAAPTFGFPVPSSGARCTSMVADGSPGMIVSPMPYTAIGVSSWGNVPGSGMLSPSFRVKVAGSWQRRVLGVQHHAQVRVEKSIKLFLGHGLVGLLDNKPPGVRGGRGRAPYPPTANVGAVRRPRTLGTLHDAARSSAGSAQIGA